MVKNQLVSILIILGVIFLVVFATQISKKDKFASVSLENFRSFSSKQQISLLKDMAKKTTIEDARKFLKTAYPNEPSEKHELIHTIGEAAYLHYGYSGLGKCDSLFMFGCYHGVVLEAIRQNGYNDQVLKKLADACLNLSTNKTITTACSHGIGHAIMVVKSYDLLTSYKDCDRTFVADEELFYCWDGVSMENIMRRFEKDGAMKFLKADDAYYPCNVVDQKYQAACVREHVFYIFEMLSKRDMEKAKDYCFHFSAESARFECTSAIGNFLNQAYFNKPQKIIDECNKLGGDYTRNCIIKAATQYSFSSQPDKAKLLCEKLLLESDQQNCLGSVNYARSTV